MIQKEIHDFTERKLGTFFEVLVDTVILFLMGNYRVTLRGFHDANLQSYANQQKRQP